MRLSKAKWKEKKKINAATSNNMEYTVQEYDCDTDYVKIVDSKGNVKWIYRERFMEDYYELV